MYTCMCVCVCIYMYVCMYVCIYVRVCMYVCMYVYIYMYICMYMYVSYTNIPHTFPCSILYINALIFLAENARLSVAISYTQHPNAHTSDL